MIKCGICYGKMVEKNISETFELNEHVITVNDYIILECSNCGDSIVTRETISRFDNFIEWFCENYD